jgi:hypothetical protein
MRLSEGVHGTGSMPDPHLVSVYPDIVSVALAPLVVYVAGHRRRLSGASSQAVLAFGVRIGAIAGTVFAAGFGIFTIYRLSAWPHVAFVCGIAFISVFVLSCFASYAAALKRITAVFALLIGLSPALSAAPSPNHPASVMVISLDDSGELPRLTSPDSGVKFDIDGDGDLDQVAWIASDSNVALLVMDVDRDGLITSGKELFGSYMIPEARNGPNALLHLFEASGAPMSGAVERGHQLYEQILLWSDVNHDGVSEPGELRPAKELFTGIGLGFITENRVDKHGNGTRFKGWAELRTGGLDQGRATERHDHFSRLRHYYEVVLTLRSR